MFEKERTDVFALSTISTLSLSCLFLPCHKFQPLFPNHTFPKRPLGVARVLQRGGGGHTVSKWGYSPDCHVDLQAVFLIKKKVSKKGLCNYGQDIVMEFSPPVVGC